MLGHVAILEDNADRLAEMESCLSELLPQHEHVFFDDAGEMIEWLEAHQSEVVLISLDHDLPLRRSKSGNLADAGTGRQVVDHLARVLPTCPVIVHTSNERFGPGMLLALNDGGWPCRRIYPHDEHRWIRTAWAQHLKGLIQDGWIGG